MHTKHPQILVKNVLVDDTATHFPTFVMNGLGQAPDSLLHNLVYVELLQSVAPLFRVVVLTDQPILKDLRRLGWLVEHFPAPEHRSETFLRTSFSNYFDERIKVTLQHIKGARLLAPANDGTFHRQVADLLGVPAQTVEAIETHLGAPSRAELQTDFSGLAKELGCRGTHTIRSTEGQARVNVQSNGPQAILIIASVGHEPKFPAVKSLSRVEATEVAVTFSADSTVRFEASVYARLARLNPFPVSVLLPWRQATVKQPDVRKWIDLAIHFRDDNAHVTYGYHEAYTLLQGSTLFDWATAIDYGSIRNASRAFSDGDL